MKSLLWGVGISSIVCCIVFAGLWGTTLTENTSDNRELFVRTTLRELVVYIFFLVDICLCKYSAWRPESLLLFQNTFNKNVHFHHPFFPCRKCDLINLKR